MIKKDLPELPPELKKYALHSLARTGLTLADCTQFFADQRTPEELEFVKAAQKDFAVEGELEVDDNAPVSTTDENIEGAYVSAWVWVSKED